MVKPDRGNPEGKTADVGAENAVVRKGYIRDRRLTATRGKGNARSVGRQVACLCSEQHVDRV